ncbi:MAG: hypothetical protein V2I51_14975, partial [Anderseniella sp.]|nr:hypothetical protein [Anderseniella sp.]
MAERSPVLWKAWQDASLAWLVELKAVLQGGSPACSVVLRGAHCGWVSVLPWRRSCDHPHDLSCHRPWDCEPV